MSRERDESEAIEPQATPSEAESPEVDTEDELAESGPSDINLIKQTLQGDKNAWIEVVRRYQQWVFAKAAANAPTPEEAAKLAQTVFVRAYNKLNQLDDALKLPAFLNAQMESALEAVNEAKGNKNRRSVIRREKVKKACEAIKRPERSDTVYEYLRDLPQRFKTLIALKNAIDLDYERISSFTGMAPTAVRGRLHQIKYKLARFLRGVDTPRGHEGDSETADEAEDIAELPDEGDDDIDILEPGDIDESNDTERGV